MNWLVNGIYWEAKYPIVIGKKDLKAAVEAGTSKFKGITDISADYEGSCDFTSRFTSIEEPFLLYDPIEQVHLDKINEFSKNEILYTSVDHLPAEMPREASNHFGSRLFPFVKACLDSKFDTPWEEVNDLPLEIHNAVIAANGDLTPNYTYIRKLRAHNERMAKK